MFHAPTYWMLRITYKDTPALFLDSLLYVTVLIVGKFLFLLEWDWIYCTRPSGVRSGDSSKVLQAQQFCKLCTSAEHVYVFDLFYQVWYLVLLPFYLACVTCWSNLHGWILKCEVDACGFQNSKPKARSNSFTDRAEIKS